MEERKGERQEMNDAKEGYDSAMLYLTGVDGVREKTV